MGDYSYPSIFFANFLFLLLLAGAGFFFVRSFKDGYWGRDSEEPKYRMLEDDPGAPPSLGAPRSRAQRANVGGEE